MSTRGGALGELEGMGHPLEEPRWAAVLPADAARLVEDLDCEVGVRLERDVDEEDAWARMAMSRWTGT